MPPPLQFKCCSSGVTILTQNKPEILRTHFYLVHHQAPGSLTNGASAIACWRYGICESRFDRSQGFARLPGHDDVWLEEMARMGPGGGAEPAPDSPGDRSRHQLLRYCRHVFCGRE